MKFPRTSLHLAVFCAVSLLAGCATTGAQFGGNQITRRPAAASVDAGADWSWNVSGDNAVRPVQVFSLKGKTYMQMRAGQLIPAVIVDGSPVPFTISPPYLVIQGVSSKINLLADGYRAIIMHRGPVTMPQPKSHATQRVHRVSMLDGADLPDTIGHFVDVDTKDVRKVERPQVDIREALASSLASKQEAAARIWRIEPSQKLLSHALRDWSKRAGLRLVWQSNVDVPITGKAQYHEDGFLGAMSHLLADASTKRYHFFYSVADGAVTVVAIRFHNAS